MEITCTRCHQTVQAEDCYCPSCGLPQLVYTADPATGQTSPERWTEAVRDASMVDWKPAIRAAIALAFPAGLLCSMLSPVGMFGLFWMTIAAAFSVVLYVRTQEPAWITTGAGARIGLVTGLMAAWLAFTISGGTLFVQRDVLHHSSQLDSEWKDAVILSQQMTQQMSSGMSASNNAEAQAVRTQIQTWMLSPWGHAGVVAFGLVGNSVFLLFFGAIGGALGARMLARARRPQV
jgi:hypothetical protein